MPKARHPKAAAFTRQNLFAGLDKFSALETRITALADDKVKGDAFEVFAEAYLATQRKHDAATVWPLASVPTQILQTLGLAAQDYGVDGVFQTLLGNFNAYQVKFRTGRPALTWRELSTFMGLADSERIHSRALFTNCDELPAMMNDRQGFFCVRGSDLDRLEADDFRAIEAWLADAAFTAPRKQPQPHQTEALNVLLPALVTHDRVSAIMACGSGKTLVALWIAEHLANSGRARVLANRDSTSAESRITARPELRPPGNGDFKILVLLPSLALLRQTLHEWLHETSLPALAYLCVCSDATVKEGIDAIDTPQSDLDFQVTTDRRSVREFLDAPFAGVKVVFSTYQSARVVGEALRKGETFDLGVFDEAHKTAGREGRNYAFALEDVNLPIRKRLFLTATPRHYNPLRKDKEGDAQLVFSMDRPEVYGPQAFRLTFAEAARRGIICGYKVVISVITSEMVTNELLSHGEVLVNGDPVRARQVANQIALRDAIGRYGVKKVFTFHSTVKSAASFVSDGNEGIGTHLHGDGRAVLPRRPDQEKWAARQRGPTDEFQTFHVNGTMPTARREREMRDFRAAARAVMSNARCLTEGVDVPAVDMVAFLSPRRSRVDIVQATGRAMRRAPGKTTGYVLVPLYLEQAAGETIEQAVARAEFDDVWDVLQSLQEQDEVLAEIVSEMQTESKQTNEFDDARLRERVEIVGPSVCLDALQKTITTVCLSKLVRLCWRPFEQARNFSRSLRLRSSVEWRYISKTNARPVDIPAAPNQIYKYSGWVDWGDWLGTGTIANAKLKFLPFEEAREFARSLPVKSQTEWREYCKSGKKPPNIPAKPNGTYARKGWAGYADWLGTDNRRGGWRPFDETRAFVRALRLASHKEWGRHADSGSLPPDIPKAPDLVYREHWTSWGDFLGHERPADQELAKNYWPFEQARAFARKLQFKAQSEWLQYCSSGKKPNTIPSNPQNSYGKRGWKGWADWLGTKNFRGGWRPFEEAKRFARSLELSTRDEWSRYCDASERPDDIPNKPDQVYAEVGWSGWGDWLGSGRIANQNRKFWPFLKARAFVRRLKLRGYNDWRAYGKSPERPAYIPFSPQRVYGKKGWVSWPNWVGTLREKE
ncbi:MAG: DEAD/DEAH box helicase family protein [Verrucomicrobia bacterium]|nr:DEAD/DEAH box helicase family protein [Verrucomicrobiota bacterium]